VRHQHVTVRRAFLVHSHARALGQVQRVHGNRLQGVQHGQVHERHVRPFGNAGQFFNVLRVALLGKRHVLARLDHGVIPGKL